MWLLKSKSGTYKIRDIGLPKTALQKTVTSKDWTEFEKLPEGWKPPEYSGVLIKEKTQEASNKVEISLPEKINKIEQSEPPKPPEPLPVYLKEEIPKSKYFARKSRKQG